MVGSSRRNARFNKVLARREIVLGPDGHSIEEIGRGPWCFTPEPMHVIFARTKQDLGDISLFTSKTTAGCREG